MRYAVSCAVLIFAATAFAVVPHGETVDVGIIEESVAQAIPSIATDLPDGIQYGEYFPPVDESTLANPDDPTSNMEYVPPMERAISSRGEGPVYFNPGWDWYDDILIYGGQVGTGQDWDVDELTGDIYAVFDTDHVTGDTLRVMRSIDGGLTWSEFLIGTNTDGSISNPRVRVLRAGGDSWVIMLGIWNETSGDDVLWTRRVTTSGSGITWEQITTDALYADLDADIGTGAYAYVAYIPDNGSTYDVYAGRNAMGGSGWVDVQSLFGNTDGAYPYPCVAAGAGGNVSVGFIDHRVETNDEWRIKRSTDNGSSWIGSEQVSDNTGGFDLSWLDLTFNHAGTQVGWMISMWAASTDNVAYYYTTDSGVSWTYGTVIGHVDIEDMPSVRVGKTTSSVTLAYNADPGDSTMFSWTTSSSPTGWSTPVRVNDPAHNATSGWPPTAGWINSGSNWSAVMFTCWTLNYSLYFDWYGSTGIEEGIPAGITSLQNSPNPFSGSTRIDFSLIGSGPVSLEVFDVSGRLVSIPIDGQNLEAGDHSVQWNAGVSLVPGVYFSRLTSGDQELTQRMVLMP